MAGIRAYGLRRIALWSCETLRWQERSLRKDRYGHCFQVILKLSLEYVDYLQHHDEVRKWIFRHFYEYWYSLVTLRTISYSYSRYTSLRRFYTGINIECFLEWSSEAVGFGIHIEISIGKWLARWVRNKTRWLSLTRIQIRQFTLDFVDFQRFSLIFFLYSQWFLLVFIDLLVNPFDFCFISIFRLRFVGFEWCFTDFH